MAKKMNEYYEDEEKAREDPSAPILPEYMVDPLAMITRLGQLAYPLPQLVSIVSTYFLETNRKELSARIQTKGTPEHEAYNDGWNSRTFAVENALLETASSGDADAQKTYLQLQVDKSVNQLIEERFFSPDKD